MSTINVSFYNSIRETVPSKTLSIDFIIEAIRIGTWEEIVLKAREDLSLKQNLPCFTPTGVFERRTKKQLICFTGLICFDIDNISNVLHAKAQISQVPWVRSAFITPSGQGLKVLVKTDVEIGCYQQSEKAIAWVLQEDFGLIRDGRATGISQPQYVSFDPHIYYNENSEIFKF